MYTTSFNTLSPGRCRGRNGWFSATNIAVTKAGDNTILVTVRSRKGATFPPILVTLGWGDARQLANLILKETDAGAEN